MTRSVAIIGAPTSAGAYAPGQEDGPDAVRDAGLVDELTRHGLSVVDLGNTPRWRWRPDREYPRAMNKEAVASSIRAVAELVSVAAADGHLPLVLGGDCTIEIGTVLGMRPSLERLKLLYFDAHPDLNVPEAVPDGAFDWMGVAHLLDIPGSVREVAAAGERVPALDVGELVLFANSPPRCSEHELRVIEERGIVIVPESRVLDDPAGAAAEALAFVGRDTPYLVHFDTDTIDFAELPIAENTDRNVGLEFEVVMHALDCVLAGDGLAAVTISELNPHHGTPDGGTVRTFVQRLARSMAGIAG